MTARIYFDHAGSSPLRPCAREAMLAAMDAVGNPSSVHAEGQAARAMIEQARRDVAAFVNVRPEQVIFTSGGTEANNLALRGLGAHGGFVSAVEHDCVLKTGAALGFGVLPVDEQGVVREVEGVSKGALVSVMMANNETGVRQDIIRLAAAVRAAGGVFHTDAVQVVGHEPVDFAALGVDALTFSGHKMGAPMGVGALIVRSELDFIPQMTGGAQERKRRAGTENVPAIAGLGAVVRELAETGPAAWARMDVLAALLDEELARLPNVHVVAGDADKVSHIRQVRVPGKRGEDMVIAMDLHGVAVSQGSACGSGRVSSSHVLRAMGWDEAAASEVVRLSLGWNTTPAEIVAAVAALKKVAG